jgi:hypothetical protein
MEILPCKRIVFIASDITPLMIKKDPFQIPYELAQLGFNVTVVTSYDSINVPGCQMQKNIKKNDNVKHNKIFILTYLHNQYFTYHYLSLQCCKDAKLNFSHEHRYCADLLLSAIHSIARHFKDKK